MCWTSRLSYIRSRSASCTSTRMAPSLPHQPNKARSPCPELEGAPVGLVQRCIRTRACCMCPRSPCPRYCKSGKPRPARVRIPYVGVVNFGPGGPQGLPLVKPPYGRITAINLNTGEHLWMRPVGEGPRAHPALRHLHLPPLGWPRRSFALLTKSLLFVAQQGILRPLGPSPRQNADEW